MIAYLIPALFFALFLFILGIALGHSATILRLRSEENRKLDLDGKISQERGRNSSVGDKSIQNYDELMYRANLRREIEDITRDR